MILANILRDSDYKLNQFKDEKITKLEQSIVFKQDKKGSDIAYIECLIRKKQIKLTPEEVVRQLYLMVLIDDYQYSNSRIAVEESVSFGREKKRADIVVFDAQQLTVPYIIIELKKPKLKDGKEQLKSYCNATGAPIGVWTNGESISYYNRRDPNYFIDIPSIPKSTQKLTDILTERWTIQTLVDNDKLIKERKSLKDLILEMEDEVLANAGVDVFEELFQLIFTKLFDELSSTRNPSRNLEFRNYGETGAELKEKIQRLFDEAKQHWEGVFDNRAKITLTSSHLEVCVSSLQGIKLFNSNLDVVDEAFEYLINKSSKGDKGQYFTPRYVIDMCVKMLNPQAHEYMIDTAAGSCGFPVHTIFHVWKQQLKERGLPLSHLFTAEKKLPEQEDYVRSKVFAIDFDERAVRVARTLNLIAGDGQTNVMHLNTLDYDRWNDYYNNVEWTDIYGTGWKNIRKLLVNPKSYNVNGETKFDCRDFNFDIIMANPPFAGEIKESRLLAKYELSKNSKGKQQAKVGRDILFIERNLDFLKPGGRMAVVLPQGRFNNSSDKYIREYIADRCRILGVVGLHGNVFKPHTGTKTSVLLLQKWNDDPNLGPLCPRVDDYPIFFATMQEPSKDNSGEKIYVKKQDYPESAQKMQEEQQSAEPVDSYNDDSIDMEQYLLDSHGHLIVKHDLFNHEGLTQDGIAEAFIEFAKKEKLSFF
ncbi:MULTISPECIES: N-6 DNA methylase [unclassified Gilliamella]|uniref:N-6 DNA methylase n=1 Tax=unclassified Gilliamella TaxID=2685620 RepID=UPI00226A39C5|nr:MULTISPECIES: N-6 DNA methylase [unclassified Gilliamella]MCX8587433.1 N-6 DNA methylase [Gilliamella sp. B3801]MCX8591271.1 N-6 DNA methylase [Gilliamella sp. B3804]